MRFDGLMMWVEDVRATADYYRDALDIPTRWIRDEGDYAQLETGEATLQLAAASAAHATGVDVVVARPDASAPGFQLSLATEDVAAAVQRAVDLGGSLVAAPVTKPWGQVVGYVRDINGFLIEIATPGD